VACAALDAGTAQIRYSGVGNVAGTVVTDERSRGLMSHNGTLGVKLLKVQQLEYDYPPGARVIMHSDGLSARWTVGSYPGLAVRHCAVIAAVLYRDQRRIRDDVTVLVASTSK
jgi:hypothetical protein